MKTLLLIIIIFISCENEHEYRTYDFRIKEIHFKQGWTTADKTVAVNLKTGKVETLWDILGSPGDKIRCTGKYYFATRHFRPSKCIILQS